MRVLTLNNAEFEAKCKSLEELVRPFEPELIIGIATGGSFVAAHILPDIPHQTVVARRPSTDRKNRLTLMMRLVRHLPRPCRDALRIGEAFVLSLRRVTPCPVPPVTIDTKITRVLVIDDAVDSGSTLAGVIAALPSHLTIRSAAITVTTRRPLALPDYSLFNNRTLIRFPWSKDNKPR